MTIAADYRNADLDDKTRVLLAFADKLSRQPAAVAREDWEALLAAGWSREQAAEAVQVVGLCEYINRVTAGYGMPSFGDLPGE